MTKARILRIVVASPSDVQAERNILPGIVQELNKGVAIDRDVRIEVFRWETDAYPGFHSEGPQGLIDPILRIEDCDVLIGIFWKRFGTPMKDSASGTEHEFRLAYERWKTKKSPHIMIYFNQTSYTPKTKEETDQWGLVLEFQRLFPKEGLWWPYRGKLQFEKLLRNHLTQFIRQKFNRSKNKETQESLEDQNQIAAPANIVEKDDPKAGGNTNYGSIENVRIADKSKIDQSTIHINVGHSVKEKKA